ncbi:MAG: carotenoid 1,2-hydratase [Verrucomicrobiota bacterium]|nr:carotenoid 1,2-hydratase [Verrucomicrobiota bacterium]
MATAAIAADWRVAEPDWRYEFPRDHHAHGEFKTEWWYFTGNLSNAAGRRFGYQLTFFRQGIRPPGERDPQLSRFIVDDLKFAHFTVTDVAGKRFRFEQKTSRGAFGEAGFDDGNRLAWIDTWTLELDAAGAFRLRADAPEASIDLQLSPVKPPAIHGESGLSQKAAGAGHASHYYSLTRLASVGNLLAGKETFEVTGESWFDHEWATNQLAADQSGWDWLSVHFADGTELMLYQMRLETGAADPSSSGTFIAADGATTHLPKSAFTMSPTEFWKSEVTGAKYPIGWRISVPGRSLECTVRAALRNQELALTPLAYWEGAVEIEGTRAGRALKGRGYLELTGYAGALRELQR